MIRVLVVDDSEVSRLLLSEILNREHDISVISTATDGEEAIRQAALLKPDIITMDINMPGFDGFSTTRKIMEESPVPIIIISGIDDLLAINSSFKATLAGALAVLKKPPGPTDPSFKSQSDEIVSAIRVYSEVKVIRRRATLPVDKVEASIIPQKFLSYQVKGFYKVVVVGASTGGPPVIQQILLDLPKDYPLPILLVQHMLHGFSEGFAHWLNESTGYSVKIASADELLRPGTLYIAPDDSQIGLTPDLRVTLEVAPYEHNQRPSVSYLFRSAARSLDSAVIGIILTGMGSDGSLELGLIRQAGGITMAQDKESSVVYGMPGAAVANGSVSYILTPKEIAVEMAFIASDRSRE